MSKWTFIQSLVSDEIHLPTNKKKTSLQFERLGFVVQQQKCVPINKNIHNTDVS